MPLMLNQDGIDKWLGAGERVLSVTVDGNPPFRSVSPRLNKPLYKKPNCIEALVTAKGHNSQRNVGARGRSGRLPFGCQSARTKGTPCRWSRRASSDLGRTASTGSSISSGAIPVTSMSWSASTVSPGAGATSILSRALSKIASASSASICRDAAPAIGCPWPPTISRQPHVADMAALIARLDVPQIDWLGVSLGGLIGMMLAAQPKSPLKRLILDDIGAFIGLEALQRIASYVGQDPGFADLAELEAYTRAVNTGYGPLAAEHWRHIVEHGARRDEAAGCWRQHYDPKIIEAFKAGFSAPVVLWPLWAAITCPVLVLRGANSDLLTAETAREMVARKPGTALVEFAGVGHAPMLMDDAQIAAVQEWLLPPS